MITASVSQNDLRKLNAMMDEMKKTTGAEMKKVVRNTARDLVREAIKLTPKAERGIERWVRIDPDYRVGRDGKPIFIPARKLKPRYRGKNRRLKVRPGLARSGWSGCLVRLGVGKKAGKSGLKFSDVDKVSQAKQIGYLISNNVPFIEDLDRGTYVNGNPSHILERSIRIVNRKMASRLNKMARDIIKKTVGI